MNLANPSRENMVHMLNELQKKLTMANTSVMNPDAFELDIYEDLLDLFEMVMRKERFSISEMEAIVSELGSMRKK
ncbi:DUF1128 domain-containing protein [Ammoniphilus sp. CFH 90114]|uniref:DUF1128 domain-containing protein n=1 Tax=Ammoniphilus sp. CFH 90114 TaxID=2493665 RepID=UPI00100F45AE|nr:DUF1128 domain-containing protein [Ammoniphilus sp. CFH 90114]RXT05833.1 DUF1128 domain-containing protein [Ammoniphilus sp. CFH 90114]